MPFVLHPYAAVRDGYVTRFIDSESETEDGEVALPVVADADPVLGPDERLWGPDFEVTADYVRAYGRVMQKEPEELLADRLKRLEQLITELEAKVA